MLIPAKRVKIGTPVVMALSTLAVEIIKAALTDDGQQFCFQEPDPRRQAGASESDAMPRSVATTAAERACGN
ncbi:hypothetical protein [Bradyrhizobium sp.]|uniref:hypothetical protein n=1 Tax=Bradyrhizobium sp. TaxID=376 RepID=UPI0025C0FC2F|nr:hypothetical protein [Bradyrhizobium sp.]MBV8921442.1 hypothetical protein [Bradyrhizobium sp.]